MCDTQITGQGSYSLVNTDCANCASTICGQFNVGYKGSNSHRHLQQSPIFLFLNQVSFFSFSVTPCWI